MPVSNSSRDGNMPIDRETIEKLKRGFAYKLFYQQGVWTQNASLNDYYLAVSYTVRDRMQQLFINSIRALQEKETKIVCYLSAEFLMGPHLHNNLVNLDMFNQIAQAAEESGLDLQQIIDHEEEPGLGNGGLGQTGRLLHGFVVQPADPRYRLRHPLRIRHVRSGNRKGLAEGAQ